ncbi:ferritin-like domain-containing protein [Myxococcota bacterium]|nr:ferritin-like domain-containing protein [Myxococcota bacterium]
MAAGAGRLPRPSKLGEPSARAHCLARFAHHELLSVELFAWALLRWPDLPAGLQRDLQRVLADEQAHCRLYLHQLKALGYAFHDFPRSDYLWKHLPAIDASPHGISAFLCAMGLTFEQANLDFTLIYRDAFRNAGDEASAQVCQVVHDDEVRHVALAAHWLEQLDDRSGNPALPHDSIARYEHVIPFPLGAARAKGRVFDTASRQRAGLSEAFIEHVRQARSSAQLAGTSTERKSE